MDRVLGDDQSNRLGDVLGDAGSDLVGPSQRTVAIGAGFQAMIDVVVDHLGRRPSRARMTLGAAGAFAARIGLGLEEWGDHRRRGRRGDDGGEPSVRLRQILSQGQECEDDGFFAQPIDFPGLLLGERRSQGNGNGKGLDRHRVGSVEQSQDQEQTGRFKIKVVVPCNRLKSYRFS